MKYLILFLFIGLSGMGYSQVNDHDLGTKNGCLDADRLDREAVDEFLNNESLSETYKTAYFIAWLKCRNSSCSWNIRLQQITCQDNLPDPSTTPRPREKDFPDSNGQNEQP